jgi:DNA-binding CsgD family transcriptional regulator
VLRVRGDVDAAEPAFERAAEFGYDPQPRLAWLRLQHGRIDAAPAAVRRLLAEPRDPVHRAQLLPAAVHVLVAENDLEEARRLAEELSAIAQSLGCPPTRGDGCGCLRRGIPCHGRCTSGVDAATPGRSDVQRLGVPYDAACSRVLLGRALRAIGDTESAERELAAARRAFIDLGTAPALKEVDRRLARTSNPNGLTDREVEVLRLVASGRSNAQVAAELYLSEKTVARHLSNIFPKIDVSSRTAAAAYAFEHGLL